MRLRPVNTTRSRLRSNPLLSNGRQRSHIRCVRSTMLQNMLRAAKARGTRRREYFAAAVAARSRSRQAIMAAFLRILLPVSDLVLLSFSLSFSPFFSSFLPSSLSDFTFPSLLRFLSFCPSTFYTSPFSVLRLCRFLSVGSRLSYPSPRYRSRSLTGMRSGVASPSPTHLHVYLLSYTHT